jgi:hypothetical protein
VGRSGSLGSLDVHSGSDELASRGEVSCLSGLNFGSTGVLPKAYRFEAAALQRNRLPLNGAL